MPWRDHLPVHPAADLFPMMPESDLVALGEDIKNHGLKGPIAIRIEKGKPVLLDGRNRLDAIERAGLRAQIEKGRASGSKLVTEQQRVDGSWFPRVEPLTMSVIVVTSDPIEFITSANVHRRHLMPGQKRDVVAALLKENPERSDRATAKIAGVDNKTVASIRDSMESREEIPHVDKVVDTKGRRQPTSKPKPPAAPREPTAEQIAAKRKVESSLAAAVLDMPAAESRASTKASPVGSFCRAFEDLELAGQEMKEDDWRLVVNALGEARILRLASTLKTAVDGTRRVSAAKSAADRAEARAKSTL